MTGCIGILKIRFGVLNGVVIHSFHSNVLKIVPLEPA